MVLTSTQAEAAFNHVLDNVLGRDDISALKQSLLAEGMVDIFDLCSLNNDCINALVYNKSDTETNVAVPVAERDMLKTFFFYYVGYARANGNPLIDNDDWKAITQEDYNSYCLKYFAAKRLPAINAYKGLKRESTMPLVLNEENFFQRRGASLTRQPGQRATITGH
jgi:hypothetical protein